MNRRTEEQLLINGPAGELEILVTRAENPAAVAVICHPHPLHGGTMHNKVVSTLMRAARDRGASTVRFNFRGVGKSAGEHAGGVGEIDDCRAVIDWASTEFPGLALWLMGFSFGGYVAAAAAAAQPDWPQAVVLVAPSVERQPFADLMPLPGPATVMMGEADEVVAPQAVFELLDGQPGVNMVRFPETSHFFHGKLVELKEATEQVLG
ncbi:alpha/beta hydrolase [Halopseudomonas pertucinogena]|uniref:Alpha/beta hydrolase n=1 Tax=Halopseudomonas pertucinogena TaxID=86175 RepID=A0ABQ2CPP8_9GAMM|nr:alpha/beta fold hydrolase [Halopseudomonas pertucinogena]GGJ00898.1 alpha/beta hydrolase [Halopseudomonas pertucinogena]